MAAEVVQKNTLNIDIQLPDEGDERARDLVGKLLKREKTARISITSMQNHAFLSLLQEGQDAIDGAIEDEARPRQVHVPPAAVAVHNLRGRL